MSLKCIKKGPSSMNSNTTPLGGIRHESLQLHFSARQINRPTGLQPGVGFPLCSGTHHHHHRHHLYHHARCYECHQPFASLSHSHSARHSTGHESEIASPLPQSIIPPGNAPDDRTMAILCPLAIV